MKPNIYRYVVRYDGGTAPNPFDGWCTLAICKPRIRKAAAPGDWIIGFRSGRHDQVVYAMKVEDTLSFSEYWNDKRFRTRRPGKGLRYPDNFYRPRENGEFDYIANHVHGADDKTRDLSGARVLVSKHFWYFGDESPAILTDLAHLIYSTQGHVVHKRRRHDDVEKLQEWLANWRTGMIGQPIDALASAQDFANKPDCSPKRQPRSTC